MQDILAALCADADAWRAAKAASANKVDLNGANLDIPPSTAPCDLSGCLLNGCTIRPKSGKTLRLNVADADLSYATFAPGSLLELTVNTDTRLDNARLEGLTLTGTDLRPVHLKNVSFVKSTLRNVQMPRALDKVDFGRSILTKVSFADATLTRCRLASAIATSCNFDGVQFDVGQQRPNREEQATQGSPFAEARFTSCSFRHARLGNHSLTRTQFINCDLRGATGLVLDDTVMRNTVLSPGAPDSWSILRRSYTGANMAFNLIFLVIFFFPLVLETTYWTGINQVQLGMVKSLSVVNSELAKAPIDEPGVAILAALERVISPQLEQCLRSHTDDAVRANPACLPVWKVLLGVQHGLPAVILTGILLTYNAFRLLLTWRVAPLRDEERGSFHSPSRRSYAWMIYVHWAVNGLFFVAVIAAIVHLWPRLIAPVWLTNT